ncbi:EcsC family protein [Methylomarinovum caldicuralii]|uniref:EcsC family protein n=1 Tax=Methylomarinovum caldicuralii TaxID=438856 RepID=UPI002953587E|nr:EcsC family protein [Methylomarinovum caldicuralii]
MELGFQHLPANWYELIHGAARTAVEKALDFALSTLAANKRGRTRCALYQWGSGACGALGGFFGLPALAVELPFSTVLMLRSIAAIARDQGERLDDPETRLACLEVFAHGGRSHTDDSAETGYYGVRLALTLPVAEALSYLQTHGLQREGAPVLLKLITSVADRFGIALSQRAAALAIPMVGAAAGAAVNAVFMRHFQDMAKGHFTLRRLERKYSPELIEAEYRQLHLTVRGARKYREAA